MVYMDGANMNAQVGLTNPYSCGADVCHLNLHKTFCIPHGGGGPGMGPILVNDKLSPFLPKTFQVDKSKDNIGPISSSEWSSASILTIPYLYIKMMGSDGLTDASKIAILNSNYLKHRLENYYPIVYSNKYGRVGHEFILDLSKYKSELNITETDISKRLIDYSFHPPTMSWPINGAIMIEPTESESKEELDRFCDAMISIYYELEELKKNNNNDNVFKNAPHSMHDVYNWKYDYSIEKGCFPIEYLKERKFWPSVSRVNDSYGDKQLLKK